jgi:lipopolysaccharide/colanic/teichoic acid biosynthesis glycosyltransferase
VTGGAGRDYRGKRLFDLVVAAVALALLAVPTAILALVVVLTSPGGALHRARRVGRGGVEFTLYKLRSMRLGAQHGGPAITAAGDPRVTAVGRFLRATKLDEVPQLINVLRGEMSIVGPRPEDPRYVARYSAEQAEILSWRPGITSPASVRFRNEEAMLAGQRDLDAAYMRIAAEKIEIDRGYFSRSSLAGDVRCLLQTVVAVFRS